jgi:hypothetical protein
MPSSGLIGASTCAPQHLTAHTTQCGAAGYKAYANRYLRACVQRKKARGPTHSLRRPAKLLSSREKRFVRAVNHEVIKAIISISDRANARSIAVEGSTASVTRNPPLSRFPGAPA